MYARVTIIRGDKEKVDDAIDLYKKYVVPAAKAQKGFKGITLLSDKKTGKGISITYWNNEKDALSNEDSKYYQEQLIKFMGFFKIPPIREGYEVVVKE